MLVIDSQHKDRDGPGADPGIHGSQRAIELEQELEGTVRLANSDVGGAGVFHPKKGRSRAQLTRLIGQYIEDRGDQAANQRGTAVSESGMASDRDIEPLAEVDEAHETLGGPATLRILYRALTNATGSSTSGWRGTR